MSFNRVVAPRGGIPAEPNEFVGRTAELRQLDELLNSTRLVTLVGPGGVGKTRVALRAAAAAAPRYPDGVWLVQLSGLRDRRLLPHIIAQRIGAAEHFAGSPSNALLAHLRDRRLLLILDTCEHLIDACAELADAIVAGAPSVTVLATSREPLNVTGETTVLVRPLPVPGAGSGEGRNPFGMIDLEEGAGTGGGERTPADGGDAVELFARRAAAAVPGFAVTEANRAEVVRLCRRLDGVPLTIELAAGRLKQFSLAEISRRLDNRLALLTGSGDPDERHATARNAIAWSYDTCTTTERTLWARLSVFPASFDAAAAAEVCASGELSGTEIFETILRLVDKSLMMPAVADGRGRPRYRMLDTIREFGAEQLTASGEDLGIRDRFIARYLSMARHVEEHVFGDEQLELFSELRREQASIRAALEYSLGGRIRQPDRERDGAELTTRLWAYWVSCGRMVEADYWLSKALELIPDPCPQRAWVLAVRCFLGAVRGAIPQAVADGRAAVRLAESLRKPLIAGRAHISLCLALTFAGQLDAAVRSGRAAQRRLAPLGDVTGLIVLDAHLAVLHQGLGQPAEAIACYQRGIERFGQHSGERVYHGYLHVAGAFGYLELPGMEAESARVLSLTLLAKYDLDEVTGTAYSLELLGWLAAGAGRHSRAAWLMGAADPLWVRCGARLSNAVLWEPRHEQAVAIAREALGAERYAQLFDAGAQHPLDQVVALAINDAETLDGSVHGLAQAGGPTGPSGLSDHEWEIAFLVATGLPARQIARRLFTTPRRVEEQLKGIFAKLGISSLKQLGPWLGEELASRPGPTVLSVPSARSLPDGSAAPARGPAARRR
ncbi:LuxR family transcriptional regulator [Trebonia kvetii]|uniref:LuxR family transcriptional regulator n=1 Tax=Trebonia kvetii TaxID=2480626 RepID=A0A6P2C3J2_9ACTN|nr:LuxR family transcriptional regulator [Trebonia kvetii]